MDPPIYHVDHSDDDDVDDDDDGDDDDDERIAGHDCNNFRR
jgi:hypothetical protein